MLAILSVTFPFFALVLCGYVATRRGMLPLQAIGGLNSFVLYFALPCMLYRFGASTPMAQLLDPALFALYFGCAVLMVALAVAVTFTLPACRRLGRGWNDAAFGALVAVFPNTGFMGVPLLAILLGRQAIGPVIATILIDILLTTSLCVALSRMDAARLAGEGGTGWTATGRIVFKGVLGNPLPWSIALGALASGLGVALPTPVMGTISLLAEAAPPVALFTIGAMLSRSQMSSVVRMPVADYLPMAIIKLLIHPLLLGGVGLLAIAAGLPLSRTALVTVVLVGALPSNSNAALLADRFGADNGRIARIILLSTVLAFFSFSAAVALLT